MTGFAREYEKIEKDEREIVKRLRAKIRANNPGFPGVPVKEL